MPRNCLRAGSRARPTTYSWTSSHTGGFISIRCVDVWRTRTNSLRSQVPKVKFAMHFLAHVCFIGFTTVAFLDVKDKFDEARTEGKQVVDIGDHEILFWIFMSTRVVAEIAEMPDLTLNGLWIQCMDPFNRIDYVILLISAVCAALRITAVAHGGAENETLHQLPMDLYAVVL
eukprot:5524946-Prymnesium_polylepis.1